MKTQTAIAGLGATAALAVIALNYQAPEGTQLFSNPEILTAEDYKFMNYVSTFGKRYGTKAEFEFRSNIFKSNLQKIEEWNNADNTHTLGINEFTDKTETEMKRMLGFKKDQYAQKKIKVLDESNLADEVDWTTKGAVTPVKNQGQCGSCWSFSTTGAVEGAMFQKTGTLASYSEQQLVDCSGSFGNMGCNGGLMDSAFQYIEQNPLELESEYPYTAMDGSCKATGKGTGLVADYFDVTPNSVAQLKAAIAKGPTSVAIEADQFSFQAYTSGVITKGCGTNLDHGVLAVGYGTLNGVDYFLVKNSWGASWGDKGYVRIGQQGDVCGILLMASQPTE